MPGALRFKFRLGFQRGSVEKTLKEVEVKTRLDIGKIERVAGPLPPTAEIITRYRAGYKNMAEVVVYRDPATESFFYHINEPDVSPLVENLYTLVRETFQAMDIELPEKEEERELVIERYIQEALSKLGYEEAFTKYPELSYYVVRDVIGWRIIDVPMRDVHVEELDYSNTEGTLSVVLRRIKVPATWVSTNIKLSEEDLIKLIEFLAFKTRKQISVAQPILEAKTPEGYRVAANLKEVSKDPGFTIRKFPEKPLSLVELVRNGTMSPLLAAYLWTLVENQRFILIIGGMASGKSVRETSLLTVRVGNVTRILTFRELWSKLSSKHRVRKFGEMEAIEDPDIEILTLSGRKVSWVRPRYLIRHVHRGRMYKVRTESGREIEVTPDHSLLVWDGNRSMKLRVMKPTELKPHTHYLPILKNMQTNGVGFDRVETIEVVEYNGYVYDLEVPETQNFEANGVFVHNTTVLQAITSAIPSDKKVVTIEDVPELRLAHRRWQALYTRRSVYGTEQDVTLFDLARYSLRTRAQYIIIGEVRDKEMQTLVQMAASGHGSLCLPGDEYLLVRNSGRVRLVEIGDLVEDVLEGRRHRVEVLTYNARTGTFEWKPVRRVYKVPTSRWVVVKTHEGRQLKVTPDHRLPVLLRNGSIVYKKASEIVPGDALLLAGELGSEARIHSWNLVEEAVRLGLEEKLYVDVREYLQEHREVLGKLRTMYRYAGDWTRAYAPYVKVKDVVPFSAIRRVKYGAKARRAVPPVLELSRDLGYIIGLYLAVGSVSGSRIVFYLSKGEGELARGLVEKVRKTLGVDAGVTETRSGCAVVVESKLLAEIFARLFGTRSEDKAVPDWMVFEAPREFVEGLVKGYWDGDGHIRRHGASTYMAVATTVSRELAYRIHYALKRLAIDSSVRELPRRVSRIEGRLVGYRYAPFEVKVHGGESMLRFAELMGLETPSVARTRSEPMFGGVCPKNVLVDVVKSVEVVELEEPEWSYDIEVEGLHNFVYNASVVSSNCTFHAEDPVTLFLRMTSPPLNVQPSFLITISAVLFQARVWSAAKRDYIRRTARVWEITGIKPVVKEGEIPVQYKEVFVWDPETDTHYPADVEDLVEESHQIKLLARAKYGEERWREKIVLELAEKEKFIRQLVREGVTDFAEVTERIYRKSLELRDMLG